ncbi:serine/threonine-protein kinase VRK1-like [Nilaparvata lugens]|uniref:serine/threonine-protein kinase VRK1-like n=1 Tax=Nilaparvata lugens TaxID=108931 RepID=UPI00193E5E6E|nr:serine/threonine-protein kinase VRK1-like [Nilaparvata lugens]
MKVSNNFLQERFLNHSLMKENMCYYAVAQTAQVQTWMVEKNMTALPIPEYVNSGSYFSRTEECRFLIIPRYGTDVQRVLLQQGTMHIKPTCTIAYHMIDALEFLHSHGYVHSNIKPDNIVLGLPNQAPVYLLDFGEARRYPQGDIPIAHGSASIQSSAFTSRDGHNRLITRRGDLEMVAYNVIHLLTGHLPWEDEVDFEEVARKKNQSMEDVNEFLSTCFMHTGSRHPVSKGNGSVQAIVYRDTKPMNRHPSRQLMAVTHCFCMRVRILKPVWTYGIQLWGCTQPSNIDIIQRFQNKVLRSCVDAPWYIRNSDLHRDLGVATVISEI